jgi:GNAT superfamily N-acetyltransferase
VPERESTLLSFRRALEDDALMIAYVRAAAAAALTERYGRGPWSNASSERGVIAGFRDADVIVAIAHDAIVGTFRMSSRKPWAIDRSFFSRVRRPLYLTDMAVHPKVQRRGVGRALLVEAERVARAFPADAIWLDAYDAEAGAGEFYAKCGFEERGRKTYRDAPLVYFEQLLR